MGIRFAAYISIVLWFARKIWARLHRPRRKPHGIDIKLTKARCGELGEGVGLYAACIELNKGTMYAIVGPVKLFKKDSHLVEKMLNAHYTGGLRKRKDFYRLKLVEDPVFRNDIRPASEFVDMAKEHRLEILVDIGAILRFVMEYSMRVP
jgi:hypothetical protein